MKSTMSIIGFVLIFALGALIGSLYTILTAESYNQRNLKAFNTLNGTSYTLNQWLIYEYDIKKLHPFKKDNTTHDQ